MQRSGDVSCHFWRRGGVEQEGIMEESSSVEIMVDKKTTTAAVATESSKSDNEDNNNNKFGFWQRIDSVKSGVVGAVAGSVCSAVIIALHDTTIQQWEFDTDSAAISGGLFAIVYRYCLREDIDINPQLAQGVIGAFAIVRTLARIHVPWESCTALPLMCGPPLGILNWEILCQLVWNGAESFALFGGAAMAIEYVSERQWISRFPG
jgi:hypothetical protein